jgi:hypothetical protein
MPTSAGGCSAKKASTSARLSRFLASTFPSPSTTVGLEHGLGDVEADGDFVHGRLLLLVSDMHRYRGSGRRPHHQFRKEFRFEPERPHRRLLADAFRVLTRRLFSSMS